MIKLIRPICPNQEALLDKDYKHPDNKKALIAANYKKCMYCESKITHTEYGDIEHIKPKQKYPHLKFEWSNLGYSCTICNRKYKKNKFNEDFPYIDPYMENPSEFLVFYGSFIFQKNGSERGELTVNDIGLNRPELIERRFEKSKAIIKSINSCFRTKNIELRNYALNELKNEAKADMEYSLCIETLLKINGII